MSDYKYPRIKRQRDLTEQVIDAAVDGAILGAGIGLLSSIFDSDSSSILDLSDSSDTTFGGGEFGGAGAGGEW